MYEFGFIIHEQMRNIDMPIFNGNLMFVHIYAFSLWDLYEDIPDDLITYSNSVTKGIQS